MKLPRDLLGRDLVKILCGSFGYEKVNQEGSHIILQTEHPRHHRVAVPDHKPLRIGTLNAILRQVASAKNISREEILKEL